MGADEKNTGRDVLIPNYPEHPEYSERARSLSTFD